MYYFWDTVIQPVLEIIQPKTIVEIGSDQGHNTENLLEYCQQQNAKLHVIDPWPKYEISDWEEEYGELVVFHLSLSLNALPLIEQCDLVLIDGDHNWYTVFNELKLIEKLSDKQSQPFPLILLHDIGWPYGRRDIYYSPETIPDAYRNPYQKKGMQPGTPNLLETGGLNSHIYNAIDENSLENGGLTAIEDFLKKTEQSIELIQVPGLHGLGILVSLTLKQQNAKLAKFLETLSLPPEVEKLIDRIEQVRLEAEIERKEYEAALEEAEANHRSEIEHWQQQVTQLQQQQASYIERWQQQIADLQQQRLTDKAETERWQQQVSDLQQQLTEAKKQYSHNVEKLVNWIQQFDDLVTAMVSSRRWRIGDFLYNIYRKLLFMPIDPSPQEHQNILIEKLRVWEQNYRNKNTQILNVKKNSYLTPPINNDSNSANPKFDSLSVDIIICVHNALEDVKNCLNSIKKNTTRNYTLYIINDGSEQDTTEYLKTFSSNHKSCVLLENSVAEGYTRAANQGLRVSTADYVVLLNSDTVVPKLWLEKFLECGESDSRIGIIGPLSNAASWQSIPECFDDSGDWAVNSLPEGYSVNDFAEVVSLVSEEQFPRVPFINGFCFVVKKTLIETIGYLDEKTFPRGYGEENDYCLRAANAGFELAIADHAYIYHSKSKSYGHKDRKALAKGGGEALWQKHGKRRIAKLLEEIRSNQALGDTRQRVKHYIEQRYLPETISTSDGFSVLFLLPTRGGGGGTHSIVQEVIGMRKLGVRAQIAIRRKNMSDFYNNYPSICEREQTFYFYDCTDDLIKYASQFKAVVATIYHSVKLLQQIVKAHPSIIPAYYIQDYEPWFFQNGSKDSKLAHTSYTLIPKTILFAKTRWLCEIVEQKHGVKVEKVSPSLDREVYFPDFRTHHESYPVRLTAMIRPFTPRRGADRTMRVLKRIKQRFGEQVVIDLFGCDDEDKIFQQIEMDFNFNNHGTLIREEVAQLLRSADIFLDLSDYQAFGRTGLEAMACGCTVVLPTKGGVDEYAINRENALLVDTTSEEACYNAATELVSNSELRKKLRKNSIMKAAEYSISKAAASELTVLKDSF